jgi:dihydrofolate reductase
MRRVTAGLFHSLDGVVESPSRWQFDSFDEELGAALGDVMSRVDTGLLGRVSYQEWASYWPTAPVDQEFAAFINPMPKFVASHTLTGDLEWQNSRLMDRPLEEFVASLKESDGGEIAVFGSISIVRQLFFAGLLDTLTLITHPVVAGTGRHLFEPGAPTTRLTLTDSQITSKGNAILTYRLRGDE